MASLNRVADVTLKGKGIESYETAPKDENTVDKAVIEEKPIFWLGLLKGN